MLAGGADGLIADFEVENRHAVAHKGLRHWLGGDFARYFVLRMWPTLTCSIGLVMRGVKGKGKGGPLAPKALLYQML